MHRFITFFVSTLILFLFGNGPLLAQNQGAISGVVRDKNSQEELIGATVILEGTNLGVQTDATGKFQLKGIPPKSYNIKINYIGYLSKTLFNVVITNGNIQTFTIELEPESKGLNEVVIQTRTFGKRTETPLSIQSLSAEEIRSNPGGNFDISRVIQALPGVGGNTGGASFRNDIVIRGGGPNENVFYIDGIEIPVINHFSTQGSSGGPQGILNVSFIQDVTLSSSSFGARTDNALSSVFSFKQREGNSDRLQGNFRLSASEVALTMDGPVSKNTTFLASARRSYLQFLFMALDIPIRPNYWDFQYKTTTKLNDKYTLTTLGVGAIDEFKFAVPQESTPEKEYAIRSSPSVNQWNYTMGVILKKKVSKGFIQYSMSRNMLNNRLDKWQDNKENDENFRVLKIQSREIENKFRAEVNKYSNKWKYSYGGMIQYVKYDNSTYNKVNNGVYDTSGNMIIPPLEIKFASAIEFFKIGFFGEVSRRFFNERLSVNLGLRTDGNTFTNNGLNFLNTLSPRASASYALNEKLNLNASIGRYFKVPIYTILGYRDNAGNFVNKDNEYVSCNHFVSGIEYLPTASTRITVEGFYKVYGNYPISNLTGISLANLGADFSVLGNEKTTSSGEGRSYGFELFFQQKLTKSLFATISYTWFRSEFSGLDNKLIASAWDNRNLISAILGYKFKKGWEVGMKYRFAGGSPYSPFDMEASRTNYLTLGQGVYDYSKLNTLRVSPFNQFDIRVDKKVNFKKVTLDLYMDIQNALLISSEAFPNYTFERTPDNLGWKTTDGNPVQTNGSNATPVLLSNYSNTVIPTIGFILEF
jgi:outer membrane cobalamin receptor